MINKYLSASLFFILCSITVLSAQTQEQWIKAGDKSFTGKDYYAAYKYYGIALEYDSSRTDLWYQFAEAARHFDAYRPAAQAYNRVLQDPAMAASFPLTTFRLAQVKQHLEQYEEARELYEQFLEDHPGVADKYKTQAEKGIEDVIWAKSIMDERKDLELLHLGEHINSAYSDFGAVLKGNTLYYSSLRQTFEKDTMNPPRTLVQLRTSVADQAALPMPFAKELNEQGKHVGHTAFNRDYSTVYYTICEYTDTTTIRCDLYRSQVSSTDQWSAPEKLRINQAGATSTQPHVAYDPMLQEEWLYFASDRTGGAGGMDIWRSAIWENGDIVEPVNLGSINTPEDEASPSWFAPTRTLYFSSRGYRTLGDFDIYQTYQDDNGWADPQNMGAPVNSSFSDLYYLRTEDGKYAYLASKRQLPEAIYWTEEQEACCHDIYRVEVDVLELLVLTYNKLTNEELAGTTVQLMEIAEDGSERIIATVTNNEGNNFLFPLDRGKKYRVVGTKENFTQDMADIDTNAPEHQGKSRIEQKLYLEPPIILDVLTFKTVDSTELAEATVSLYEIDENGRETLVDSITNLSGNDFTFQVRRNKKYVIRGDRPGFYPTETTLDLTDPALLTASRVERKLYFPQELEIQVFDQQNRQPLANATLDLYEVITEGTETRVDSTTNTADHIFPYGLVDLEKRYLVKASRPGYVSKDESYVFSDEEIRSSGGRIIREIYLERKKPDEFLPLALYFDNDRPDPRTVKRTTDKTYIETNETYYAKRDLFISEFTEGMSPADSFLTSSRFIDFFDREVNGGRLELEAFSREVLILLKDGFGITMRLQGYASPRASSAYNEILSMRRISSVKNYFRQYEDGAFLPYLRSGQLRYTEEALGESTADLSKVSDALNDLKNSIYSISASLERRVDIMEIDIKDPAEITTSKQ